jgi:hypothetical protein
MDKDQFSMDATLIYSTTLHKKIVHEYFLISISNHFIRISLLDLLICEPSWRERIVSR